MNFEEYNKFGKVITGKWKMTHGEFINSKKLKRHELSGDFCSGDF